MKKADMVVGKLYIAKVNGGLTKVRLDAIDEHDGFNGRPTKTYYRVTNLVTRRRTIFRSATKFRSEAVGPMVG